MAEKIPAANCNGMAASTGSVSSETSPHPHPEEIEEKSVMVCPCPDLVGDLPVTNGECELETQEHEMPFYWKLVDGLSLVLETPSDDHVSPVSNDSDASQGQDCPPRRRHSPPPFLNSYPYKDVPLLMPARSPSPTAAQVCGGCRCMEPNSVLNLSML